MKKTFREKMIAKFMGIAKKHRFLKYPCIAGLSVVLAVYYVGRHFATNGKRYGSIAFVLLFFMSSCSFSFAVFADKTGFVKAQETYSAIVEDSDVTLAEVAVSSDVQDLDDDLEDEYDAEGNILGNDFYTLDDLLADEEDGDYPAEEAQAEQVEQMENYTFDSSDWRLVLVNKQHPIPEDYTFTLGTIGNGMRCDERVVEDLLAMLKAARNDGMNLIVQSPYRSDSRQEYNFNNRIKSYMGQGMSYMESYKQTSQVIMVPGASEHEIGLAFDITCDTYSSLKQGFAETEAGKWLAEHCSEYGFVVRYPAGKEYITSVEFEPWHFRYVGREAAAIMTNEGLCLEEFWDKYL